MNLPQLSLRYQPIVLTLSGLLMLWGLIACVTMPRREDPEYTVRTCAVITQWPGAPAQKVEELITDKLEEAIDSIEEVKHIRSKSTNGLSEIYVDAEDDITPERIDNVWDKVRARVVRVEMPEQGITPVVNDDYGNTSILVLAVHQVPLPGENEIRPENVYSPRRLELIAKSIRDEVRMLPGVAKVELFGVQDEAVYVETDFVTWSQIGLTISQLQQLLEARNIVAPGGSIDTTSGRFMVKPGGEFNALDEVNSVIISADGTGRPVYLRDLGLKVRRDYTDPPLRICRYGDHVRSTDAVTCAVQMKSGANIVNVCDAAIRRVREMQEVFQSLPRDISVVAVSDQSSNVTKKISDVVNNVIGAVVIVVVVVYLVVGFRTAAVMAANIPVVVLASLALMTIFDVQLEQISLASIIIALGLLVDNAVQVCDQTRTNEMAGMPPSEAASSGANLLAPAMLSGTATTVAAFFPMLIALKGTKREYIYSLPVTLSVTLGISWVLAMTLCVTLAAAFIRAPKDPHRPSAPLPWLMDWCGRRWRGKNVPPPKVSLIDRVFCVVAGAAIRAKWTTVAISLVLLIWAVRLPVGSEFFPKDLRDQFAIQVWLPETATIEQTDAVAARVEEILRKLSPVEQKTGTRQRLRAMRTMVGGGASRWYLSWDPEGAKPYYAEILVRTADPRDSPWLAQRVRDVAEAGDSTLGLEPIAGARIVPRELNLGPSADPVAIRVLGSGFADQTILWRIADRVQEMIRNAPGTWDVNNTWGIYGFQLHVDIDADQANLAGVTHSQVAQTLNAYFSGQKLTTFREGDHLVPVYLRLDAAHRNTIAGLQTMFVEGQRGKVPMESIGKFDPRWEPARIERRDRNRNIEVRSQVENGFRGNDIANQILDSPEMKQLQAQLPAGFWIEPGGALYESLEGSRQLSISLEISLLVIVLLLVIQYNGWSKMIIIMATVPLALIGALPGLYFSGNPLGFMPQLGILSLFGIVLNTGIIFVEFADALVAEKIKQSDGTGPIFGLTRDEFRRCLVDAGRQRLLPIFLTTATTIGGLIPLAISGGPLWEGMAWCMISGLIVATLLTLLVIPAMYAIFVETLRIGDWKVPNAVAGSK